MEDPLPYKKEQRRPRQKLRGEGTDSELLRVVERVPGRENEERQTGEIKKKKTSEDGGGGAMTEMNGKKKE